MNILFASAEAAPFAKVGGLGDVVAAGSLPTALRQLGDDARVIMPMYGSINREKFNISYLFSFQLPLRQGLADIHVHHTVQGDVPFYFIESWPFFGDETTVYTEWGWDLPRFIFFNQAVLALAWQLKLREGWFPHVAHAHDWHTGLVPFFVNTSPGEWQSVRSMMTLHNMAHQGNFAESFLDDAGIPPRYHPLLHQFNLDNNLLAIGCAYADFITTVSPRHADEIQYPYMGYWLDPLIRARNSRLYGVLNGIDTVKFNPETDPHIVSHFNADNFHERRPPNKRALQEETGLPVRDDVPIISMVSRLVWQKGIDLAVPAMRQLLDVRDVQFVVLGTGDPGLSAELARLAHDYPEKASIHITYDASFAQRIYAGSDLFIMPSHYEPCGIGQMIAMRYGCLPLVRETGGLVDTVDNYDNADADHGTGFMFLWEEVDALLNTLHWAVDTYYNHRAAWQRMQRRAMQVNFSWKRNAEIYRMLYQRILEGV